MIESNCAIILKKLEPLGELNLSDKSNPDDIMQQLQLSKKAFKKALGVLYKERKVIIENCGHNPFHEFPEMTIKCIDKFIKKLL